MLMGLSIGMSRYGEGGSGQNFPTKARSVGSAQAAICAAVGMLLG